MLFCVFSNQRGHMNRPPWWATRRSRKWQLVQWSPSPKTYRSRLIIHYKLNTAGESGPNPNPHVTFTWPSPPSPHPLPQWNSLNAQVGKWTGFSPWIYCWTCWLSGPEASHSVEEKNKHQHQLVEIFMQRGNNFMNQHSQQANSWHMAP